MELGLLHQWPAMMVYIQNVSHPFARTTHQTNKMVELS